MNQKGQKINNDGSIFLLKLKKLNLKVIEYYLNKFITDTHFNHKNI